MPTKAFHHTGTTAQTNIGPAHGGVLHSITGPFTGGTTTAVIRDDENIIFKVLSLGPQGQLHFEGIKLDGQLSIELDNPAASITVEMSRLL
jgi:hypothetical protein